MTNIKSNTKQPQRRNLRLQTRSRHSAKRSLPRDMRRHINATRTPATNPGDASQRGPPRPRVRKKNGLFEFNGVPRRINITTAALSRRGSVFALRRNFAVVERENKRRRETGELFFAVVELGTDAARKYSQGVEVVIISSSINTFIIRIYIALCRRLIVELGISRATWEFRGKPMVYTIVFRVPYD
ncbi:hypothetical protein EVAR_95245_1 [Eumeta japonica]|uniref:Uncharacterized protein n=1 Tax=Eumeta variegata TaxID=151549 RepID=A0A4C1ULJ6_EUMVA|nr:hypothetical protein EVAR_95245_1 [Eumeta japonica]